MQKAAEESVHICPGKDSYVSDRFGYFNSLECFTFKTLGTTKVGRVSVLSASELITFFQDHATDDVTRLTPHCAHDDDWSAW
jgi:hypothetical protein